MEKQELKPKDLMLGNYVDCFGKIEMITGIVPREQGDWFLTHTGNHKLSNPLPDFVEFNAYGIILTNDWKRFLNIDKIGLPERIKYVHEAQNYIKGCFDFDIAENFNWGYFNLLTAD